MKLVKKHSIYDSLQLCVPAMSRQGNCYARVPNDPNEKQQKTAEGSFLNKLTAIFLPFKREQVAITVIIVSASPPYSLSLPLSVDRHEQHNRTPWCVLCRLRECRVKWPFRTHAVHAEESASHESSCNSVRERGDGGATIAVTFLPYGREGAIMALFFLLS